MIKPTYDDNVIIGIKFNNTFNWYILNKLLCLLNLNVLDKNQLDNYMSNNALNEIRKDLIIINKDNASEFISRIKTFKSNKDELILELTNMTLKDQIGDFDIFYPVLFLDFDEEIMYSQYPEPFAFEKYLPNKWIFKYEDFTKLIEENEKYWIYKNKNLFEYLEELKQSQKAEKYNTEDIFKNKKKETINIRLKESESLTEYKESIIKRIINNLKKFFKI